MAITRATGVIGSVMALGLGVTFALTSQATLLNNTIASATPSLQIKKSTTVSFGANDTGFAFTGLVPGGASVPATPFQFNLKNNNSGVPLKVSVTSPAVSWTAGSVDNTLVHLEFTCVGSAAVADFTAAAVPIDATVAALTTTGVVLGQLEDTKEATCNVVASAEAGAFSVPTSTTNFNLVFTGDTTLTP